MQGAQVRRESVIVKVFISWSGEPSRSIARELSTWVSGLIQVVEPWMSDEDIGSGKRWRDHIGAALDEADFGIICVTRANQHAPWMMFESGALAKHLKFTQVIPMCVDLETAEITGPLADWQARKLDREGTWRLAVDINSATPRPVKPDALLRLFDVTWPGLDQAVQRARGKVTDADRQDERPEREILEELLDRVRRLEKADVYPQGGWGAPAADSPARAQARYPDTYGPSPSYGQTPAYGPPPSYGQTPEYGPPPSYSQTPEYGPPPSYGQTPDYAQRAHPRRGDDPAPRPDATEEQTGTSRADPYDPWR